MMRPAFQKIFSHSCLALLFLFSCVDRIDFGVALDKDFPLVIDGMITNEPGPYVVKISTSFDIDSKVNLRAEAAVQDMRIIDDLGNAARVEASYHKYIEGPNTKLIWYDEGH